VFWDIASNMIWDAMQEAQADIEEPPRGRPGDEP
jgi:hypothetical protein